MKQLKVLYAVFLLLEIPFAVYSQRKNRQDSKELKFPSECFYTKFNAPINPNISELPFSKIVLLDTRFDTSKLGYIYESKWDKQYKLCFRTNFKDEASVLLNSYFTPNFSKTDNIILACVKNISNRIIIPELETNTINKRKKVEYNFHLKVEFYLKNQSGYYPLYRFDSSIIYSWNSDKDLHEQITHALITSSQKLFNQSIYKINNIKELSYHQIDSFNNISKNIPLLKTGAAQRGIYMTFDQLKLNQPIHTNFEISLSETADLLYVKGETLKDSVIADAWGFSDGQKMFIRVGYNFFPLLRIGDNFEFYAHPGLTTNKPFPLTANNAYRPMTSNTGMPAAAVELGVRGLLSLIKTTTKDLQPYLLDMESGKIYQSFAIF